MIAGEGNFAGADEDGVVLRIHHDDATGQVSEDLLGFLLDVHVDRQHDVRAWNRIALSTNEIPTTGPAPPFVTTVTSIR